MGVLCHLQTLGLCVTTGRQVMRITTGQNQLKFDLKAPQIRDRQTHPTNCHNGAVTPPYRHRKYHAQSWRCDPDAPN